MNQQVEDTFKPRDKAKAEDGFKPADKQRLQSDFKLRDIKPEKMLDLINKLEMFLDTALHPR